MSSLEDRRAERNSQHLGNRLVRCSYLVEDRDPLGIFAEQVHHRDGFDAFLDLRVDIPFHERFAQQERESAGLIADKAQMPEFAAHRTFFRSDGRKHLGYGVLDDLRAAAAVRAHEVVPVRRHVMHAQNDGLLQHMRAAARRATDETLVLENVHCLAHGDARHAVFVREVFYVRKP